MFLSNFSNSGLVGSGHEFSSPTSSRVFSASFEITGEAKVTLRCFLEVDAVDDLAEERQEVDGGRGCRELLVLASRLNLSSS